MSARAPRRSRYYRAGGSGYQNISIETYRRQNGGNLKFLAFVFISPG